MLFMAEKGIREGICHFIYPYAETNNKYIKHYDQNKESLCFQYWGVNNLSGWAMSQKLPSNNLEWIEDASQFNKEFMKSYNQESDEGYFIEAVVKYLEHLHERHNDLPFLPKRMIIGKVVEIGANLHDKVEYVIHIRNLKQILNHGLVFRKVHRVIKLNQNLG